MPCLLKKYYNQLLYKRREREQFMMSRLSYMLTDFLLSRGKIKKSDKEIYHYGYILLLDGLLDTILLLLFGLIIQKFLITVAFVLVFTTTRMFAGGYHAKTRWQCILITFISCFICVEFSEHIIGLFNEKLFLIVGIVICYIIFILYSPIENSNKPLDEEDIQSNKTKSLVILSIYVFIIAFTSMYGLKYPSIILVTLLEVTLLMILGIITKRRNGYEEK